MKIGKGVKLLYSAGIILAVLTILSFLAFGPIKVPIFSELANRILNTEEESQVNEEPEELEKTNEDPIQETEEVEVIEQVVEKKTTIPTKPSPKPTPEEPTGPDCSEETILKYAQEYCKYNYALTRLIKIANIEDPSLSYPPLKPTVDAIESQKSKLRDCNVDAKAYIRNWSQPAGICVDPMYYSSPMYFKNINIEGLF